MQRVRGSQRKDAGDIWGLKEHSIRPPPLPLSHHSGTDLFSPLGLPRSGCCPLSMREGIGGVGPIRSTIYTRTHQCGFYTLFTSLPRQLFSLHVLCSGVSSTCISTMGFLPVSCMMMVAPKWPTTCTVGGKCCSGVGTLLSLYKT